MPNGLPIPIPPPFRSNNERLNRYLNEMRDCLVRLRDRKPPQTRSYFPLFDEHQWKISVSKSGSNYTATVKAGVVKQAAMCEDSGGLAIPIWESGLVSDTTLTGMVNNTTYGIWLETAAAAPSGGTSSTFWDNANATDTIGSKVGAGEKLLIYDVGYGIVSKDSTNTNASSVYSKVTAGTGRGYVFLGSVAIASDVVTITQYETGPITIWAPTYTHGILSSDTSPATNDITVGTDGGIYYDDPDYP